jgi:viroplasmin and RNaseH domain-containing protein
MTKWYVVYKGWVPGVYDEWEDCQKQVNKFSGNSYKGYATREEAVAKWRNHLWKENRMKILLVLLLLLTVITVVFCLILV